MRHRIRNTLGRCCLVSMCVAGSVAAASGQQVGNAGAGSGPATNVPSVIELYTSQGCSSCPAADALLEMYAGRSDVVALTLPVDYWDYLGWKDTLARPKHAQRQRSYAKARGDGRIYTPQMIVNGLSHAPGSSAPEIDKAIAETSRVLEGKRVNVSLKIDGSRIRIETPRAASPPDGGDATIWLAIVQRKAEVPIRTGENRGKTLSYFNVVRELTPVGMWNGQAAHFELSRESVIGSEDRACAVLVQSHGGGPIMGAAAVPRC